MRPGPIGVPANTTVGDRHRCWVAQPRRRIRDYTDQTPAVLSGRSTAAAQDRDDETIGTTVPDGADASKEHPHSGQNLVRALSEASFAGDLNAFPNAMLDDFEAHVPGRHFGRW
jgi:hypothetical protein